jgi:hypothetical protein
MKTISDEERANFRRWLPSFMKELAAARAALKKERSNPKSYRKRVQTARALAQAKKATQVARKKLDAIVRRIDRACRLTIWTKVKGRWQGEQHPDLVAAFEKATGVKIEASYPKHWHELSALRAVKYAIHCQSKAFCEAEAAHTTAREKESEASAADYRAYEKLAHLNFEVRDISFKIQRTKEKLKLPSSSSLKESASAKRKYTLLLRKIGEGKITLPGYEFTA